MCVYLYVYDKISYFLKIQPLPVLYHLTVPLISVSGCVFFPFPKLGQLSNALRWSAGFGLCSYFAVRLLC